MNVETFFKYWGLEENPFQAEEARNDPVYLRLMDDQLTHPDFDKIYGAPVRPGTAVVFGDKGSGKTAIRLLLEKRINDYNKKHPDRMVWMIRNDDLNPFIDRLMRSLDTEDPDLALSKIELGDHQDEILSKSVTRLVDFMMGDDMGFEKPRRLRRRVKRMTRQKRMDFAELAAIYDQPHASKPMPRWHRLKMMLRVTQFFNLRVVCLLSLVLFATTIAMIVLNMMQAAWQLQAALIASAVLAGLSAVSWLVQSLRIGKLAKTLKREVRVVDQPKKQLTYRLSDLPWRDLSTQPMPANDDKDARYELTARLLRILDELGYVSMVVIYDRIDEPVMVNGEADKMKNIIWPMFQNKFLQQEGVGIKMLLPLELSVMLKKESSEFYQHARLDKQNMIERLVWSGTTLYDICSKRLLGCQEEGMGKVKRLTDLFEEEVTSQDIIDALDQMLQPRDAFKFLYRVIQEHCHHCSDEEPQWRVPKHVLENIRREQSQRVQEFARGMVPA